MSDRDKEWVDFLTVLRRALLMIVSWIDKRLGYNKPHPPDKDFPY